MMNTIGQTQQQEIITPDIQQDDRGDRIPSTQREIIQRVSGATEDTLFWMRVDKGKEFLTKWLKSEETARKAWSQEGFWTWWLRLWAMADRKILTRMTERGLDTINWNLYVECIEENIRYHWIPGKVFPAINVKL